MQYTKPKEMQITFDTQVEMALKVEGVHSWSESVSTEVPMKPFAIMVKINLYRVRTNLNPFRAYICKPKSFLLMVVGPNLCLMHSPG